MSTISTNTRKIGQNYPVVDLFAGAGGLGEGFSSLLYGERYGFSPLISIEQDEFAHKTLLLRHFFHSFDPFKVPPEYYKYITGELMHEELIKLFPSQWEQASKSALCISLGEKTHKNVHSLISSRLKGIKKWVLVGGPPCQAYSLVGRSRRANDPQFEDDEKHFLYREYLKIIADHKPPVFVMENVKGLLSAKVRGEPVLIKILSDLSHPKKAVGKTTNNLRYKLFSLSEPGEIKGDIDPTSFVVKAEDYGIPQARHRMFIVGIRSDLDIESGVLERRASINVRDVIGDLPSIRSGLSKSVDNTPEWRELLRDTAESIWIKKFAESNDPGLQVLMQKVASAQDLPSKRYSSRYKAPRKMQEWFCDDQLNTLTFHETRSHMKSDLQRYFFASAWALRRKTSPKLSNFPLELLPEHKNVDAGRNGKMFADRFRVQLPDQASTTVTSHISKDGHYFIHYDPAQCRSLTVRETARLQTFPDNYFFEGPRTSQYHQVGNAVPPFLANQIAEIIHDVLDQIRE